MVLAKSELIASLQNEVRIVLHLAGKIDRGKLDYRPTAKQRSTLELLQYLTIMGPALLKAAKAGTFDPAKWTAAVQAAAARDFDQTLATLGQLTHDYPALLADISDDELRGEIHLFGGVSTRGAFIVNHVLCGCAAYRMQLFLYLKACGREELGTLNLWAGIDPPAGA